MLKIEDEQKQLHIKLTKLEREVANVHSNKALKTEIITIKTELEITTLAAAHAPQIRPRAKFTMKNGSAPGSDGLTTEFHKNFWPRIKCIVINSYKHLLEIGRWSSCTLYLH